MIYKSLICNLYKVCAILPLQFWISKRHLEYRTWSFEESIFAETQNDFFGRLDL